MHDRKWREENLPSVPLSRKSPTHHDVVEEGIIPEVLPQFVKDEPNLGQPWKEGEHHGEDLTPAVFVGQKQGGGAEATSLGVERGVRRAVGDIEQPSTGTGRTER
jgi:hypothetical protein